MNSRPAEQNFSSHLQGSQQHQESRHNTAQHNTDQKMIKTLSWNPVINSRGARERGMSQDRSAQCDPGNLHSGSLCGCGALLSAPLLEGVWYLDPSQGFAETLVGSWRGKHSKSQRWILFTLLTGPAPTMPSRSTAIDMTRRVSPPSLNRLR